MAIVGLLVLALPLAALIVVLAVFAGIGAGAAWAIGELSRLGVKATEWIERVMPTLVVVLLATSALAAPSRRQQDFIDRTHLWAGRMGVEVPTIVFGYIEGNCGWVGVSKTWRDAFVAYDDLSGVCRLSWTVDQTVLHEMCHLRLAHLYVDMPDKEKHREVDRCMVEYKRRERRGDYRTGGHDGRP